MSDDIFCKVIRKELGDSVFDEGENWIALKDIHPQAPVHILIIPKKHIGGMEQVTEEDVKLLGELIFVAKKIAQKTGISENGYRIILNQGDHGGQAIGHLHFHLLGGKPLGPKIVR